jgi:isocitrate/isopropylmalate dehydrogenase
MAATTAFRTAALPGDGIGQEVVPLAAALLETVARRLGGSAGTGAIGDAVQQVVAASQAVTR